MLTVSIKRSVSRFYNKHQYFLISIIIICIALAVRINYFDIFTRFGHDASRELITIFKLFEYNEWFERGPQFSIIWGILPPTYYYFLTPITYFLNFSYNSIFVNSLILNLLSIVLILVLYKNISKKFALVSAAIYAVYVLTIKFSLYGLNPNFVEPLFLIYLYFMYQYLKSNNHRYLFVATSAIFFGTNFHLSSVVVIITQMIILFIYLYKKKSLAMKKLVFSYVLPILVFCGLPYLYTERKSNFFNTKQLMSYIRDDQSSETTISFLNSFSYYLEIQFKLFVNYFVNSNSDLYAVILNYYLLILFFLISAIFIYNRKKVKSFTIRNLSKLNSINDFASYIWFTYIILFILYFIFLTPTKASLPLYWLGQITVPLVTLIVGYHISKFDKYVIMVLCLIIFTSQFMTLRTSQPISDSLKNQKEISSLIWQDIQQNNIGDDFIIRSVNPEPYYFIFWTDYLRQDTNNEIYNRMKWSNQPDNAKFVYNIINNDFSYEDRIKNLKDKFEKDSYNILYKNQTKILVKLAN